MKLNPLTVGPIIGEATPQRVRIWGRGHASVVDGMPQRCFGAVRVREAGTTNWGRNHIIKMNPNFDMTGIAVVSGLSADTSYEYQFGCFFSEGEFADVSFKATDEEWSEAASSTFTTGSNDDRAPRTLAIGSCRYLLQTFLGDFFDNRGDKTFRSIGRLIDAGERIDQLLMMGDQIYADDLRAIGADRDISQFYRRYRSAFGQEHIRNLMSRVPTYMTLDDHEIEDNWPARSTGDDTQTLFPVAMHAYQTYQLGHSPCIPVSRGRLVGVPHQCWYNYTDGCCDVFVLDCRTERMLNIPDPEMISSNQLRALKRWLNDASQRAKIVVSSVPFFPDPRSDENNDKWSGFLTQRDDILDFIDERGIRHVAFFSGDIHATVTAELELPSGVSVLSVISSAFFWPYPHTRSRKFQITGNLKTLGNKRFALRNASRFVSDDNFSIVKVRPYRSGYEFQIASYERKGKRRLLEKTHRI
jgi:alkaline phosphatase D